MRKRRWDKPALEELRIYAKYHSVAQAAKEYGLTYNGMMTVACRNGITFLKHLEAKTDRRTLDQRYGQELVGAAVTALRRRAEQEMEYTEYLSIQESIEHCKRNTDDILTKRWI